MKRTFLSILAFTASTLFLASALHAAGLIFADDGRVGYEENPKQWWSEYVVHDIRRPIPKKVEVDPANIKFLPPPPDAKVLFDGKNLDQWLPTKWIVTEDGLLECTEGPVTTKDEFGDFQLHLEFKSPKDFEGPWGNCGNNGVLIFDNVEIQIFDNCTRNTYPDGWCGSVYGQNPPLVNACIPVGNWNTYDIFFKAPTWTEDGKEKEPARVTIMLNGVMIQNSTVIYGGTGHGTLPVPFNGRTKGHISFSGHGCPVQFRNVWIRAEE